jgi:hypothetical protein
VLSTTDGAPSYGAIQTTLSVSGDTSPAAGTNIQIAPSGAVFNYSRTITLDAATMASLSSGKAVVVVHGLDPATAAPAATTSPSELVPSLPLAATSPALCGTLVASTSSQPSSSPVQAPAVTQPSSPAAQSSSPAAQAASTTMRPPNTGDAGLLGEQGTGAVSAGLLALGTLTIVAGLAGLKVASKRA